MPDLKAPPQRRPRVLRAFALLSGTSGLGLLGGLGYGAWRASALAAKGTGPPDEVLDDISRVIHLALYGTIGLGIGLVVGLLAGAVIWAVRLVRR